MSSESSISSAWKTSSGRNDPYRPGLVERAKKRTVTPSSDRLWWRVAGMSSLGDSYDTYDVHLRDNGDWYCSCTTNRGGEYRKVCSHRTAVMLWRKKHEDPWEDEGGNEDLEVVEESQAGEDSVRGSADKPLVWEISGDGASSDSSVRTLDSDDTPFPEPISEGEGDPDSLTPESEFDPWELDWDNPPPPKSITWSSTDHPLPDKFEQFRPEQWHGIIEVVEALDDDSVKAVFLSAPTGTGKSLIAATVPQIIGQEFIYTCTTHVLQQQVEREFYYADVLKGRRNYPTFDDPALTADDCTKERTTLPACPACPGWTKTSAWTGRVDDETSQEGFHCHNCHPTWKCPYEQAKDKAANSRMAVLNTAYFLNETATFKSRFKNWPLVIMDEADMLEQELMNHITVEITAATRKDLGVGMPVHVSKEESWVEWLETEVVPAIKAKLADLPVAVNNLLGKPDTKVLRARKKYERLLGDVRMLLKPPPYPRGEEPPENDDLIPALTSGWVMTGYETKKGDEKQPHNQDVIFKPITVRDYAYPYLWSRGHKFVLMSATIISPEQMAYDLGLEDHEWVLVDIPSSFPKERRPIVDRSKVSVTNKTITEAYPVLVEQLVEIMEQHPEERILVHSNSYKLTRELFFEGRRSTANSPRRMYTYLNPQERNKALDDYLKNPRGVLIAPSFERGVDLHGDDCRVLVVAKVPYPYLGDKQISARLYGTGAAGRTWYSVETIRSICQMTGRGMRSKDDAVITYILDGQFADIYWRNPRLFPKWWSEAIVWDENDPKWRESLKMFRERTY